MKPGSKVSQHVGESTGGAWAMSPLWCKNSSILKNQNLGGGMARFPSAPHFCPQSEVYRRRPHQPSRGSLLPFPPETHTTLCALLSATPEGKSPKSLGPRRVGMGRGRRFVHEFEPTLVNRDGGRKAQLVEKRVQLWCSTVRSMPARLQDVIKAQGGPKKW